MDNFDHLVSSGDKKINFELSRALSLPSCGEDEEKIEKEPAEGGDDNGGGGYGDRDPMTCFNCNEEGHKSSECPEPKKPRGGGGGGMACFNCNEEGHRASDCP